MSASAIRANASMILRGRCRIGGLVVWYLDDGSTIVYTPRRCQKFKGWGASLRWQDGDVRRSVDLDRHRKLAKHAVAVLLERS